MPFAAESAAIPPRWRREAPTILAYSFSMGTMRGARQCLALVKLGARPDRDPTAINALLTC
jgi:hypothetical protein